MKQRRKRRKYFNWELEIAKGNTNKFYNSTDFDIYREKVLERDKYTCQFFLPLSLQINAPCSELLEKTIWRLASESVIVMAEGQYPCERHLQQRFTIYNKYLPWSFIDRDGRKRYVQNLTWLSGKPNRKW